MKKVRLFSRLFDFIVIPTERKVGLCESKATRNQESRGADTIHAIERRSPEFQAWLSLEGQRSVGSTRRKLGGSAHNAFFCDPLTRTVTDWN